MSKHLFGIVVTPHGTAANNRGETEGNLTTLQKLLWNGQVHTTVSAEAIRWAIRQVWQQRGQPVNRRWDEETRRHAWQDGAFASGGRDYLDDDVLGYMSAEAAKQEGDGSTPAPTADKAGKRQTRARGTATVRRARLEVTRAISLTPWAGDVTFNSASVGATPSASSSGRDPVPYAAEIHATRYQYGFALTPESLNEPVRALEALAAIVDLYEVAGNHGRFFYDFAPDTLILRWTDDFAPRMLYAFALEKDGTLSTPELVRRVEAGDVAPDELVVGGSLATTDSGQRLSALGATVLPGVKAAAEEARRRLVTDLRLVAAGAAR